MGGPSSSYHDPASLQKKRQVAYHEAQHYTADSPRHPGNSHPAIAWLNTYRLRRGLSLTGESLAGQRVLSVCGGDGLEAEYLRRRGARVTMVDLSPAGVAAARARHPELRAQVMDAERLSFADGSFDWPVVLDGLHHLSRPLQGLYEMERVARRGLLVLEAQDSWPVRCMVRLGLADAWDPAGGYVYRFTRREMQKIFNSLQTAATIQIRSAWLPPGSDVLRYCPLVSRWIYPLLNHRFLRPLVVSRAGRRLLKAGYGLFNGLFGRWGNALIMVVRKHV
jgi:SAM-dependent methyltransferase